MEQNKMTPTPWLHFPQSGLILSDKTDETVVYMNKNIPPVQIDGNADAIVLAVNNTYGAGINPEAVPELLRTLKTLTEYFEFMIDDPKFPAYREAKEAIYKAKKV